MVQIRKLAKCLPIFQFFFCLFKNGAKRGKKRDNFPKVTYFSKFLLKFVSSQGWFCPQYAPSLLDKRTSVHQTFAVLCIQSKEEFSHEQAARGCYERLLSPCTDILLLSFVLSPRSWRDPLVNRQQGGATNTYSPPVQIYQ